MTLIRLVHRASILTSMAFASLFVYSNPARADVSCIVADNGKAMCGTLISIPRMCISTGGKTACGKFTSIKQEGESQSQSLEPRQEASNPPPISGYRKQSDNVTYLLRNCRRVSSDIKCNFVITTKKEGQAIGLATGKGYSSIVDSAGRTYPSSNLEYNGNNSWYFNTIASSDVEYVVDINFENVSGQINKAALISINTYNGNKVIQFRNVPFSN
jgi:hypothetical protein